MLERLILAIVLLVAICSIGAKVALGDGSDPMPACRGKVCPPTPAFSDYH